MKRSILLAFFKALVISVGFHLICTIYGFVSQNPYQSSLEIEVIFFLLMFFTGLIEYWWKDRKRERI